jgi:hypothetical protein
MSIYVSAITLEVNGVVITDFNKVIEKKVEHRKAVNLMNKTGFIDVTERFGVDVEYVLPKDAQVFDFTDVADGTLTIDFLNGARRTCTGVYFLSEGDITYDGEKEASKTIEFGATGRVDQ